MLFPPFVKTYKIILKLLQGYWKGQHSEVVLDLRCYPRILVVGALTVILCFYTTPPSIAGDFIHEMEHFTIN